MRILMTGSHGFVGTNLIQSLSSEHEIIRWDVRQDLPLPEVDAVIHLAGKAHDTQHTTEAEEYFRVNTELTKKIYNRFLESTAKKFIFFSSIKAQDGDTPYAQSKRAAEEYLIKNLELREKKEALILRPCMIYGKGMKGNLPLLLKVMKTGIPWPLAAFENQHSQLYYKASEQLIQEEFRIEEELPERLLDLYIAACNDNPRWWYPAKNAGGLLYDQGKFNEAIYYLTRAYIYDEDPDGETAYYLGSCFMELGNTDDGFPLMVQALDLGVNETIESHISWYLHTLTAEGGNQNEETDS